MVAQYIGNHPILDLCLAAERSQRMRLLRRWWEHPSLDILGIRASRAAEEMGEETVQEES